MVALVSPEGMLFIVKNRDELDGLGQRLHLNAVLLGNLRQLFGFIQVGGDGRAGANTASDWCLLEKVTWVQRDGSDIVYAAIGSRENARKIIPLLNELSDDQVKKLFGKRGKGGKWSRVKQPAAVNTLGDCSMLVGLRAEQPKAADYANLNADLLQVGSVSSLAHGMPPPAGLSAAIGGSLVDGGASRRAARRSHRAELNRTPFQTACQTDHVATNGGQLTVALSPDPPPPETRRATLARRRMI